MIYAIEYDYDGYVCDCEDEDSGYSCSGMHCHQRYVNLHVREVDIPYLAELIMRGHSKDEILHYCVDRLLRIRGMYYIGDWTILTGMGYYGEEIHGATHDHIREVVDEIIKLDQMNSRQKMEYILTAEYGYLLPDLEKKKWSIMTVEPSKIRIPNDIEVNLRVGRRTLRRESSVTSLLNSIVQ